MPSGMILVLEDTGLGLLAWKTIVEIASLATEKTPTDFVLDMQIHTQSPALMGFLVNARKKSKNQEDVTKQNKHKISQMHPDSKHCKFETILCLPPWRNVLYIPLATVDQKM